MLMPNQVCNPKDTVPPDQHKHQCHSCGTCFRHEDASANVDTDEEFKALHTCPGCGAQVTKKVMDDEEIAKSLLRFFGG